MPFYSRIHQLIEDAEERIRTARNLIALREQLDAVVPAKDAEDNLLLATWNIRDFGKPLSKRRGWGPRLPETWFYIAEVISRFDFVAVQEVNELPEWLTVMSILGSNWDYIATDETDPSIGGNGERMTFVYDRRKVSFQSIAGEIVLPPKMLISRSELKINGKQVTAGSQFRRTPFMASYQSGWLKFDICTVHLYYGAETGAKLDQRIEEISRIAEYLGKRADRALGKGRALILLGDFNIVSPEHQTMQALVNEGFVVPAVLTSQPTTGTKKHYDQIAFKTKKRVIEYIEGSADRPALERNAGVVEPFKNLFTDDQLGEYEAFLRANTTAGRKADTDRKLRNAYRSWRTYQLSDHYPMWVRIETDGADSYLRRLAGAG